MAFGRPSALAPRPVFEPACRDVRASQARHSYRNRHGTIDRIGAAAVAAIGYCQHELFDGRPLESRHAVELVPAGVALLRLRVFTAPVEP